MVKELYHLLKTARKCILLFILIVISSEIYRYIALKLLLVSSMHKYFYEIFPFLFSIFSIFFQLKYSSLRLGYKIKKVSFIITYLIYTFLEIVLIFFENILDKAIHADLKEKIINTATLIFAVMLYMVLPFTVFKYKKMIRIISLFVKKHAILVILLFIFNCVVYKLLVFFIKRPRFTNIDATLVPEFLRNSLIIIIAGISTVLIYKHRKKIQKY
jgi:hypothetical protein